MRSTTKRIGIATVVLALSAGLASSVSASAAPTGQASALTKAKCKKIENKKKRKRCLRRLRQQLSSTTVPQQATIILACTNCFQSGMNPVTQNDNSNITFAGSLTPNTGPALIKFSYRTGKSTPITQEFIPVDSAGNFSKTFTLNNEDTYNNQVAAEFAGDANRTSAVAVQTFFVFGN